MRRLTVTGRHFLTFAAITMAISSALISFFFVQHNDRVVMDLKRSEEKTNQLIMTLWNNASAAEHDADTAIIISLLARQDDPSVRALKHYYRSRAGAGDGADDMEVLKAADDERKRIGERIDALYIEQLNLENTVMERESMNKRQAGFALLLQLLSLVLVILTREMPNG